MTTLTALPTAPDPATMTPSEFSTAAAAFVLAVKAMVTEINGGLGGTTVNPTITGTVTGTGATWNLGATSVTSLTSSGAISGTTGTFTRANAGDVALFTNGGTTPTGLYIYSGAGFSAIASDANLTSNYKIIFNTNNNDVGITSNDTISLNIVGTNRVLVSPTGLAVTGAISATGGISGAAGSFTTLSASGEIGGTSQRLSAGTSSTTLAGNYALRLTAGATAANYSGFFFDGSTTYDSFFGRVPTALSGINDGIGYVTYAAETPTLRVLFSSTGLAVTGALSATGAISGAAGSFTTVGATPGASTSILTALTLQNSDHGGTQMKFRNDYGDLAAIDGINFDLGSLVDSGKLSFKLATASTLAEKMLLTNFGLEVTGAVSPSAHNTYDLGTTGVRWKDLWLQSGAFNGSDARLKTAISPFSTDEINAAKQLGKEIGHYQWLESMQAKGANNARHHIGLTVQSAIEILEQNGLDPFSYGFIGYDKWEDKFVEHPEIVAVEGKDAVLDEEGNVLEAAVKAVEGKAAWTEQTVFAGDAYSFRYDQLNLFIARGFEARLAALEAAV